MSNKGNHNVNDPKANSSTKIEPSGAQTGIKQDDALVLENSIVNKLVSKFGDKIKIAYTKPLRIKVEVDRSDIIEVASFIKETLLFDHAESVAGTDYPKGNYIEVVYHLGSYTVDELGAHVLALATRTGREDSSLPSLIDIYKSVDTTSAKHSKCLESILKGIPEMIASSCRRTGQISPL